MAGHSSEERSVLFDARYSREQYQDLCRCEHVGANSRIEHPKQFKKTLLTWVEVLVGLTLVLFAFQGGLLSPSSSVIL